MRTIIRLQNHGCKNHPFWWITVQGSYTNPRGRFLEHIGYWIPYQRKTVQRAVILNKHRIRYWLSVGAVTSRAVQRLLAMANILPPLLIPHGRTTIYPKPDKKSPTVNFDLLRMGKYWKHKYGELREQEEYNLMARQAATAKQFKAALLEEGSRSEQHTIPDSLDERTKEFYRLKEELKDLEKDFSGMSPRRRDQVFRRMNRLAEKGITEAPKYEAGPSGEAIIRDRASKKTEDLIK